ncbi:hypothetical protein AB0H86_14635 [Streptomyces sp. NPDC050997]
MLNAERLATQVNLAEVQLRLGQHARVVAELSAQAEQHTAR